MTPEAFADLIVQAPPRFLGNFAIRTARSGVHGHVVSASFGLSCRACGGDRFAMAEVTVHRAEDGLQVQSPVGLLATCSKCAAPTPLFNAARDGYDGENGHLDFLRGPTTVAPLESSRGSAWEAQAVVSYSVDPVELREIAAEIGVSGQDLFDWFALEIRTAADRAFEQVWDYECA